MLVSLLQRKLDENLRRLDDIQAGHSSGTCSSDEHKLQELVHMAEAQREMFKLDLKFLSSNISSSSAEGRDDIACTAVQEQMESSDERNLTSAMLSLERAILQCDNAIIHKIETAAEAIEAIIPALNVKLQDRKSEMAESHDSSKLLTATVESNYGTMRDGYLQLLRKVFEEARVQWKALLQLQEPTSRWQLDRIQEVIDDAKSNPELDARREQIYQSAQQQLDAFCAKSFEKIRHSTAYREKEECLQQIATLRHKAFEHKLQVVREKETLLGTAEAEIDSIYMDSLEGINQHLYELQDLLNQLAFYERRITHLLGATASREAQMDRLGRDIGTGSAVGHSAGSEGSVGSVEELVRLGQRTREDLRAPFRMGAVLRGLAGACDLPPEDTERLLEYVLFAEAGAVGAAAWERTEGEAGNDRGDTRSHAYS